MPLAYTKTFAKLAAALSITLAPPLMVLLLKGRFRTEETNPVSRLLSAIYRPIASSSSATASSSSLPRQRS